jgi:hypothetical protein
VLLGEFCFELGQPIDDPLLGAVALDLSSGDARRILHRDGSGHERMERTLRAAME